MALKLDLRSRGNSINQARADRPRMPDEAPAQHESVVVLKSKSEKVLRCWARKNCSAGLS